MDDKNKKINDWLEDPDFQSKIDFPDKYYLETLCYHISNFLKNTPVPVMSSYDTKNHKIYFSVGLEKKGFNIDVDLYYYDYITLVRRWLIQFYPKYEIEYDVEVEYSEQEILKMRNSAIDEGKKFDLNEALIAKKVIKQKEFGIVEKVTFKDDEFILKRNDYREVRITGTLQNPLIISRFLKMLREIKDDNEKSKFIFAHSRLIKRVDSEKDIIVTYQGKQMINFFEINFEDLYLYPLIKSDDFNFIWGRFKVKFESKSLRDDCLKLYNEKLFKIGIRNDDITDVEIYH